MFSDSLPKNRVREWEKASLLWSKLADTTLVKVYMISDVMFIAGTLGYDVMRKLLHLCGIVSQNPIIQSSNKNNSK